MGSLTAPWGLSMPAEAFELGRRLCFLQSFCMPVTGCQASLCFCSRRGITVRWEGSFLPLLKERRNLATGRWSWTLLGDGVDPFALACCLGSKPEVLCNDVATYLLCREVKENQKWGKALN